MKKAILKLKNNRVTQFLKTKYTGIQKQDTFVKDTQITFLGAAGTVTGSKYLLEYQNTKILVDCGLFQGFKELRLRNREAFYINPRYIDAILLTHAHLDHSGHIPLLVKQGFRGKIYCTAATFDLCKILLPDSGFLQEEDARFAKKHGFSKHKKPKPLYTQREAIKSLKYFRTVDFGLETTIDKNCKFTINKAGHILGAGNILVKLNNKKILFSGDIGRPNSPIMKQPTKIEHADYVVVESTYGNREHKEIDVKEKLCEIINETVQRAGHIIIPAFAVGRSQKVLYLIHKLEQEGKIPKLPIFLDSPMSIKVTKLLYNHFHEHRLSRQECLEMYANTTFTVTADQSKRIFQSKYPHVIISASGMATGGRILHHLAHYAPDYRNTILFTGFQAGGTRGRQLLEGKKEIKIHGKLIPIEADIKVLNNISAHADSSEIIDWLKNLKEKPKKIFITHGEKESSEAFAKTITKELNWKFTIPTHLQTEKL